MHVSFLLSALGAACLIHPLHLNCYQNAANIFSETYTKKTAENCETVRNEDFSERECLFIMYHYVIFSHMSPAAFNVSSDIL